MPGPPDAGFISRRRIRYWLRGAGPGGKIAGRTFTFGGSRCRPASWGARSGGLIPRAFLMMPANRANGELWNLLMAHAEGAWVACSASGAVCGVAGAAAPCLPARS